MGHPPHFSFICALLIFFVPTPSSGYVVTFLPESFASPLYVAIIGVLRTSATSIIRSTDLNVISFRPVKALISKTSASPARASPGGGSYYIRQYKSARVVGEPSGCKVPLRSRNRSETAAAVRYCSVLCASIVPYKILQFTSARRCNSLKDVPAMVSFYV